jgi:hypothetical protein
MVHMEHADIGTLYLSSPVAGDLVRHADDILRVHVTPCMP